MDNRSSGTYKTQNGYAAARGDTRRKKKTAPKRTSRRAENPAGGNANQKRRWVAPVLGAAIVAAIALVLLIVFGNRAPMRMLPTVTPPEAVEQTEMGVEQ